MRLSYTDANRKAYVRKHKKRFQDCVECLYIKCPCITCEKIIDGVPEGFFDRVNLLPDEEIFDSSFDNGHVLALERSMSAASNRSVTQKRDGSY